MKEIEIKFLNINPEEMEKRLINLGAKKAWSQLLEEWIYSKPEWSKLSGRVRVRRSDREITVAYKETIQDTGQGNPEIEFGVSSFPEVLEFLEKIGLKKYRHQQKERIHFTFMDIVIDIDLWPKIPPLLEIEGSNKKNLDALASKLGLDPDKSVQLDTFQIYKQIYQINIDSNEELVF